MNCTSPFVKDGKAFGCGQCLPCRINRKRIWTHRLMLEAKDHEHNAFITLTYSDENLPEGNSLNPTHSKNFLKLLRYYLEPVRFRYFLVGEYGDQTERPHYHAALFGYPSCEYGGTRHSPSKKHCCEACDRLKRCWPHGHIYNGELTVESAAYTCGYVTKKLTRASEPSLNGRHPEFSRQSKRPGLGAKFMHDVADSLLKCPTFLRGGNDVPSELFHGTKPWPLGRYLKRRLRQTIGRSPDAPEITLQQMAQTLSEVRSYAFENSLSFKETLVKVSEGKRTNLVARRKLYQQRKHL